MTDKKESHNRTAQLLVTLVPALLVLTAIAVSGALSIADIPSLTRDVTAIANIHPLSGVLSNLGAFLWCATASICGFTALVLRDLKQPLMLRFLTASCLLSLYLLFDDFFLFHETLARRHLGLSEKAVLLLLGTATATYLVLFRKLILRTDYTFLLLAFGFLASSVAIDIVIQPLLPNLTEWRVFFEDGAKWLGIACWFSYFAHTSRQTLVGISATPETLSNEPPAPPGQAASSDVAMSDIRKKS